MDLKKLCRLCLQSEEPMFQIFTDSNVSVDKIYKITLIQITRDEDLPESICFQCYYKIKTFTDFQQNCQRTNKFLTDYITQIKKNASYNFLNYLQNTIKNNQKQNSEQNVDCSEANSVKSSTILSNQEKQSSNWVDNQIITKQEEDKSLSSQPPDAVTSITNTIEDIDQPPTLQQCDICPGIYKDITKHTKSKSHHKERIKRERKQNNSSKVTLQRIKMCQYCKKIFSTNKYVSVHEKQCILKEQTIKGDEVKDKPKKIVKSENIKELNTEEGQLQYKITTRAKVYSGKLKRKLSKDICGEENKDDQEIICSKNMSSPIHDEWEAIINENTPKIKIKKTKNINKTNQDVVKKSRKKLKMIIDPKDSFEGGKQTPKKVKQNRKTKNVEGKEPNNEQEQAAEALLSLSKALNTPQQIDDNANNQTGQETSANTKESRVEDRRVTTTDTVDIAEGKPESNIMISEEAATKEDENNKHKDDSLTLLKDGNMSNNLKDGSIGIIPIEELINPSQIPANVENTKSLLVTTSSKPVIESRPYLSTNVKETISSTLATHITSNQISVTVNSSTLSKENESRQNITGTGIERSQTDSSSKETSLSPQEPIITSTQQTHPPLETKKVKIPKLRKNIINESREETIDSTNSIQTESNIKKQDITNSSMEDSEIKKIENILMFYDGPNEEDMQKIQDQVYTEIIEGETIAGSYGKQSKAGSFDRPFTKNETRPRVYRSNRDTTPLQDERNSPQRQIENNESPFCNTIPLQFQTKPRFPEPLPWFQDHHFLKETKSWEDEVEWQVNPSGNLRSGFKRSKREYKEGKPYDFQEEYRTKERKKRSHSSHHERKDKNEKKNHRTKETRNEPDKNRNHYYKNKDCFENLKIRVKFNSGRTQRRLFHNKYERYECKYVYCKMRFTSLRILMDHLKEFHGIICRRCNFVFPTKTTLMNHLRNCPRRNFIAEQYE